LSEPRRISIGQVAGLIALLVVAVYARSLGNELVYDDHLLIERNPIIRTLDPVTHLGSHFWERQGGKGDDFIYYRPLVSATLAVEWKLFGATPWGYHATNVLLHWLAAWLVFLVLREIGSDVVATIAAALFAVHPIQVESVAFVLGRTDVLATGLVLLGTWLHLRLPERIGRAAIPAVLGVAAAFFAALLSKEAAVTFPAFVVGGELALALGRGRPWKSAFARGSRLLATLPVYAGLVVLYLVLRVVAIGALVGDSEESGESWRNPILGAGTPERLLTAVNVAFRYLRLLLFPRDLSVDYQYEVVPLVTGPGVTTFLLPLAALVALAWLVARMARRAPVVLFGVLGGAGAYALVSHVVFASPVIMADRFLYLPMVGICTIAAALVVVFATQLRGSGPAPLVWTLAALLTLPLAARSFVRVGDWRDDVRLFSAAVATTPRSAVAWNNLGYEQLQDGELDAAAVSLGRAIEIQPVYRSARVNLASVHRLQGNLQEAETLLRATARDYPEAGTVWLSLIPLLVERADALQAQGDVSGAAKLRGEAVELGRAQAARADEEGAWGGAAALLMVVAGQLERLGYADGAEEAYGQALAAIERELREGLAVAEAAERIRAGALSELSDFLRRQGRADEARQRLDEAREAAARSGDDGLIAGIERKRGAASGPTDLVAAAEAAFQQGRPRDALAQYDRALAADPDSRRARHGRGRTRLALGDLDGAEADLSPLVDPSSTGAIAAAIWTDLATVAARRPDPAETLRRLDLAVGADAAFAPARFHRGMLRLQAGDAASAETDLQAAASGNAPAPLAAEAWYRLAEIAAARGDAEEARERVAACLAAVPDHPGARALQQRLGR
jgi:tetratricopeptide (TPR) repeat protein